MAKRTAVIDIGSNSARLVIYERTSRYGFHLICEEKSKVRIGEGAYEKEGYLQPQAIRRAYFALLGFRNTIEKYRARKVLCVATSALRDAPNARAFVRFIRKKLGIAIRIISGEEEAHLGAVAASNLLPVSDAITVDIGGGSADMARIEKGKIVQTISLDLGTVRLKELFYDKACPPEEAAQKARNYVEEVLQALPETFRSDTVIGIGGTARALAKGIMKRSNYPLDKLHAFCYKVSDEKDYFQAIIPSSAKGLKKFSLKKSRFDTIREGTLIFDAILHKLGAQRVVTSSVGLREGVFLSQLLRNSKLRFPPTLNPSIISLRDRFPSPVGDKSLKTKAAIAARLLYTLPCPDVAKAHERTLRLALKLSDIGKHVTLYKSHLHAYYIAMQELNYGFTHEETILIALLLKMHGKKLIDEALYERYETLLPKRKVFAWLSFIYTLSSYLYDAAFEAKLRFDYENETLRITSDVSLYLAKEAIKGLEKPATFAIRILDSEDDTRVAIEA